MHFAALEVAQQLTDRFRLRHHDRLAQQRPELEVRTVRAEVRHEVLDVEDPHDVIDVLLEHRDARMARLDDERADRRQIIGQFDAFDVRPRRHDFAHVGVAELDDVLEHLRRLRVERAFALRFLDVPQQFGFRFVLRLTEIRAGQSAHGLVHEGEAPRERCAKDGKPAQHRQRPRDDGFRHVPRQRAGEHDAEHPEQRE